MSSDASSKNDNKLSFNPRARLIRTIGDRLISGPKSAVIELVKNAHDADASYVKIKFIPPLIEGKGSIIVEDDGHGMTLETIQQKWMEPATTDKAERKNSPKDRPLLGSKGIGRFAAARLGRNLELKTVALEDGKSAGHRIYDIDWNTFDHARYLSDISIPFEPFEPVDDRTGTTITITSLNSTWSKNALSELHKELRKLVSPLEEKEISDFRIYLDLSLCTKPTCGFEGTEIIGGDFEKVETDEDKNELYRVHPYPLLKACDYEVEGHFDPGGHFEGSITIHRAGLDPEHVSLDIPALTEIGEAECGDILIHLFVFDREADAIDATIKKAGLGDIGRKEARKILDEMCGIAIYRDRFRIRPYGDFDQDWLTLDKRRVQKPAYRIGHNQVAGLVVVGNEDDSGLVERSSREGLEENGSYKRLVRLILELLSQRIEPIREGFRKKAGIGRSSSNSFGEAKRNARLSWASDVISKLPESERENARKRFESESGKLQKQLDILEQTQARLQAQVTLGLILAEVLHEGRHPVSFIQVETKRLLKYLPTLCKDDETAQRHRDEMPDILHGLDNSADRLRSLFKTLEPISGRRRGHPALYRVGDTIHDVLLILRTRIEGEGITVNAQIPEGLPSTRGYKDDLQTAFTNICDNKIFWLSHDSVNSPTITIEASQVKDRIIIDVSDNGMDIPENFASLLFDVGFTLKTDGNGLGLSIAREALSRSNGEISLESPKGAKFRISLPIGEEKA